MRYGVQGSGNSKTVYVPGAATTETTISELNSTTNYFIEVAAVNSAVLEVTVIPSLLQQKVYIQYIVHFAY